MADSSRYMRLVPWIALGIALVVVLPAVSYVLRNPSRAEDVVRQVTPLSGGTPYRTESIVTLPVGDGEGDTPTIAETPRTRIAAHEAVVASRDLKTFWVIDHPVNSAARTRVRRFSDTGDLLKTFWVPGGTTLFTPGLTDDLWVDKVSGGAEQVLHYDSNGKLLGTYSIPEGGYAYALSVAPDGAVWASHSEWATDPKTNTSYFSGALIPVADKDGKQVEKARELAVAGGGFIGYDGLLYSLDGVLKQDDEYPVYTVIASDRKGQARSFELPRGCMPFMADAKGRVYANDLTVDTQAAVPGVSTLGDPNLATKLVHVFEGEKQVAMSRFQSQWGNSGAYPPAWLSPDGSLTSAVWSSNGLGVTLSRPVEAESLATAGEASTVKARVLYQGTMPQSGDPYLARDDFDRDLWHTVYGGLTSMDASGVVRPDIAAAIPTKEDGISKDGLSVTWRIAPGRKWHDGKPVTPEDVVATWKHLTSPHPVGFGRPFPGFQYIEDISADGDSVTVRLSEPYSVAGEAFFPFVLPAHVLEGTAGQANNGLFAKPIGTGPYELETWDSAGHWVLAASDTAQKKPKIERLGVDFSDTADAKNDFMSSQVPSIWPWITSVDADILKRDAVGEIVKPETGRWVGVLVNTKESSFDSAAVRRAMISLYPAREAFSALAEPTTVTVGPFRTYRIPVDLAAAEGTAAVPAARKTIREYGYRQKAKDTWQLLDGQPVRIQALSAGRPFERRDVPLESIDGLQKSLFAMNFANDTQMYDPLFYNPVYARGTLTGGQSSMAVGVFPAYQDPAWGSVFDPADTPSWANPYGMAVTFTADRELAELHRKARAEFDSEKRAQIAKAITERTRELQLAFYERPERRTVSNLGIRGYQPGPYPAGDFWNVADWTIEEREQ